MHPQLGGITPQRKLHQQVFSTLTNTAKSIVVTLKANPHPTKDQCETMAQQINGMAKGVKLYCDNTPGTKPIQDSYANAKTAIEIVNKAWVKVKAGDTKKQSEIDREIPRILKEMHAIETAQYIAPPAPKAAAPAALPPKPTRAAPPVPKK